MAAKLGANYRAARRNRWRNENLRTWDASRFPTPAPAHLPPALIDLIKAKKIKLNSLKRRTVIRAVNAFEHREYLRDIRITAAAEKRARIAEREAIA